MAKYRRDRINVEMVRELAAILREIKDPRVTDNFVSITAADVTPDLKFAKVYFSAMTGEVCRALEKTVGIAPADTYVTYAEVENWGWNGRNF